MRDRAIGIWSVAALVAALAVQGCEACTSTHAGVDGGGDATDGDGESQDGQGQDIQSQDVEVQEVESQDAGLVTDADAEVVELADTTNVVDVVDAVDLDLDAWTDDVLEDTLLPDILEDVVVPDSGPDAVDVDTVEVQMPDGVCANVGGNCGAGDACQLPPPSCYHSFFSVSGACCPKIQGVQTVEEGTVCNQFASGSAGTCSAAGECDPSPVDVSKCADDNPCTDDLLTNNGKSCKHIASPDLSVPRWPGIVWNGYCAGGQRQQTVQAGEYAKSCTSNLDCAAELESGSCAALFGCFESNAICQIYPTSVGQPGGYSSCVGLGQTACPPPANTCQRAQCNQVPVDLGWSATCTTVPAPDGAMCDDGNPATGPDLCKNGVCGP